MEYELTIHEKSNYLHAIVNGTVSRDNVDRYVKEILGECLARKCFRVLVEERLDGPPLGALDVFEVASQGSMAALGVMQAIAFVDINADVSLIKFAETVAVNRAIPMKTFPTVAAAEKWLSEY
jgi:hypothetical protein